MQIKSLIGNLNQTTKTAEAKTAGQPGTASPAPSAPAASTLDQSMREVVSGLGSVKEASATTVSDVLTKEAQAIEAANDERAFRRGKLAGAAFAEQALATFTSAGEAAEKMAKEAAAGIDPRTIELAKLAQADPAGFLREVERGYNEQRAASGQDKTAANNELRQYQELGAGHYLNGYESLKQAIGR
jgi:hypothetical protein